MLKLEDFGAALRNEREKASYSLANFARNTAGISKDDIRDFESGKRAPDKLTLKKIVHCFPILMQFENDLRHGNFETPSEVRQLKPKRQAAPRPEPTRLPPPQRQLPSSKPRLEIVRQHELPPEPLTAPLAPVLKQALKKTRAEMLTELCGMVKKRLGNSTADFTIKNDGKALVVKLQLTEGEDSVDSGCYLTVGGRGTGLGVFCRTMTNGNYDPARASGVTELLEVARALHDAVKDRRFDI